MGHSGTDRPGAGHPACPLKAADRQRAGFSLAETTVAVGIAAMALTSLTGLLLGSLHGHRQSADRDAAARLLTGAVADLRMAAASSTKAECSPRLGLSLAGRTTLYLDEAGNAGVGSGGETPEPGEPAVGIGGQGLPAEGLTGTNTGGEGAGAGFEARYRLECVADPATTTAAACPPGAPSSARPVMLRITWPAGVRSTRADGSLTVFVALPSR